MGNIRPHLIRYWLYSSEKMDSPETFAEKVNEICAVYQNAEAVHEKGGHTVSVDEMTGIQALEHKYPDKPVIPRKAARMEFEYIRHGTVSLIGFLDVATGRMEKPYLNPTRTEEDFVEAVRKLVETDPEASWTFVCDGLNTHKSESLIRFVAQQCGLSEDLGCKGKSGILKSLESRAEQYYTTRENNLLKKMQLLIAVAYKLIRVFRVCTPCKRADRLKTAQETRRDTIYRKN